MRWSRRALPYFMPFLRFSPLQQRAMSGRKTGGAKRAAAERPGLASDSAGAGASPPADLLASLLLPRGRAAKKACPSSVDDIRDTFDREARAVPRGYACLLLVCTTERRCATRCTLG